MRRCAEGTLGNVEKTMEFLVKTTMCHASLCRGHPRKCLKTSGISYTNQYLHASPCRGIPLTC